MRIVTDVNVIGLAHLYETARTGIYRAISSLTLELLQRSEPDICYTSLSSIEVNQLTDRFYAEAGLRDTDFPRSGLEKILLRPAAVLPSEGVLSVPARVLSRIYRRSLTARIGRDVDIFHSTYSALPPFDGGAPIRMLTIYDIIPLLHPEYFPDGFVEQFLPIVSSFLPERDYIFAISESTKNDLCAYFGILPERVFVTPLAASSQLYYPERDRAVIARVRETAGVPDVPYFLTLATVEKRKNLATTVAAYRAFLQESGNRDIHFVLVGTRGWKVDDVLSTIEADPLLKERVHFTGFLPDASLAAMYSGAIAFVYPSLYEGFGLPPLEAMQCGVPVICSNTSSLPEVIGDSGISVDPLDVDGIAGAMRMLAHDSALRGALSAKGLVRAQEFSWKVCADKTIEGYENAWNAR